MNDPFNDLQQIIDNAVLTRALDNPDNLTPEDIRLAVYEDLRDLLKTLMSDVAYL